MSKIVRPPVVTASQLGGAVDRLDALGEAFDGGLDHSAMSLNVAMYPNGRH